MPDPTPAAASATPARPAPVPGPAAVPPPSPAAGRKVLERMLDRLFAAVVNGPSMNCRPHRSRQRIDWSWLAVLGDGTPADALRALLGESRKTTLRSRIVTSRLPTRSPESKVDVTDADVLTDQPTDATARRPAFGGGTTTRRRAEDFFGGESEPGRGGESPPDADEASMLQAALFQKLHTIAEDARTYEQDTGVQVLEVGFPLLSLPPAFVSATEGRQVSRRVLAPIAFIPVSLVLRRGATRTVELSCRGDGVDLVRPNTALLTWLHRQTGRSVGPAAELFADEKGQDPWREVTELVARVCAMVDLPVPEEFKPAQPDAQAVVEPPERDGANPEPADSEPGATADVPGPVAPRGRGLDHPRPVPAFVLRPASRSDEPGSAAQLLSAAVLGLFPMTNQGLLRDMQEMVDAPDQLAGPIASFLRVGDLLDAPQRVAAKAEETAQTPVPPPAPVVPAAAGAAAPAPRDFADERLVAVADPCQARAVRLARQCPALVIHGPPGTGKSQTIANIIGDHLARGQRVLFVCEKRTALDVVADRLEHMGLGNLTGVVHDPQRDQRELYKKIRDQLENLAEAKPRPRARLKLEEVDAELGALHAELTGYRHALVRPDADTGLSFHELMGQWLAASPGAVLGPAAGRVDAPGVQWRVRVEGPAAAELAKTRLRDLAPLDHPLREMFSRAAKVGYAKNPWAQCAGIGLQPFLARTVEQNRDEVDVIVVAAAKADETCRANQPLVPPFAAGLGLAEQAAARVQLADRTEAMLEQQTPDVLDRWAAQPVEAMQAARKRIADAQPYLTLFKQQQPLDAELVGRWVAAVGGDHDLPAVKDLTQQRAVVQRYAEAFGMSMQWVDQIRAKAPTARWPTVARWMATDADAAAAVLKKLDAAAAMADRGATAPLDPELLAQYRRQPVDINWVLRWQSAVETYLPIADSFFGFLQGGKKAAALPVMQYFGLGLSRASAERARAFLAGLRVRLETWEATTKALGPQVFRDTTQLPDDDELFGTFVEHRAVLRAAADLHRESVPEMADAPDATALVNRMVDAEHAMAEPVFAMLGLPPTAQNAARVVALLNALVVRVTLQGLNEGPLNAPTPDGLMDDRDLEVSIAGHAALFDLALSAAADPMTQDVWPPLAAALADRDTLEPFLAALRLSPRRANDVLALERTLVDTGLFAAKWVTMADAGLRAGEPFTDAATALRDGLPTLEDVVRANDAWVKLPPTVQPAARALVLQSASPAEAWDVLRRDVVAAEIRRRLAADPHLQNVDGHRLSTAFDRYRELEGKKRDLVCDAIVDRWLHEQQDRLLAETGSRLNAAGAELKRRLLLRGERAMRLRQVIARGREIAGGDPLFELCPVWMVSPETAAQVFPREPIFDVVVFDEASQCRLEEALPVLVRGRRVVIAGDPKQLPPTRFFETAFAASDDADEPSTDQEWFEQQQGEVEDLLTAALGLDAQQSYLDVHYRSRNAALIGFSNEHFYGRRLQPIPGHPSRRPELPPIRLVRVAGLYEKRVNEPEADAVVVLVRELLSERKPPSIGIACFNLGQRDLIVEKLDELAAEDARFAKRLAEARERVGEGTFEGLFVKNLENVQGDERDHMIISTTYGPDAAGRFYRRFGPLAMPGGGRRLNVLVTRARQQVHLVTSIPAEAYRSLPDPADGQSPGGGWLLFAYLRYADELAREYGGGAERQGGVSGRYGAEPQAPVGVAGGTTLDGVPAAPVMDHGTGTNDRTEPDDDAAGASDDSADAPPVRVRPTRAPSAFAESLAHKLAAAHGAAADVYWGNDGFCVDLALRRPGTGAAGGSEGVGEEGGGGEPVGVLCDAARFAPADDLMEWDVFRTGILEAQGWRLHRVWTPHFFRDPAGRTAALLKDAAGGA